MSALGGVGCSVDGCTYKQWRITRGLCGTHYQHALASGTVTRPLAKSVTERLLSGLVTRSTGCIEWTRGANDSGYGQIRDGRKVHYTHRLAWALANGPIPDDVSVLHHCDNPPCCQTNPTESYPEGHLFLGTSAENMQDMIAKGRGNNQKKTHCPQGHPYSEANTYMNQGRRNCRTCLAVRNKAQKRAVA